MAYRPVGFGSHHWVVTDHAGTGWFATVDDLTKGAGPAEPAYRDLWRALDAARGLRAHGAEFVVAPVTTAGDEPVARLGERYAVALYPLVDGESFAFGGYPDEAHRQAALEMVRAVHAAPPPVRDRAPRESAVPHRDALEAALAGDLGDTGPYAGRVAELFGAYPGPVRRLLSRHDALAAGAGPDRSVLTHGEPHPGNTMRTAAGWRLIDWDTARVAPPERDLWLLGDEVRRSYAEATGMVPRADLLEMYRLRWDIADLAVEADRFRRPHTGTADDDQAFAVLQNLITGLPTR
ncbi:aminoglycoside phosphotransferase family protein [Wangella sp. NEAU-J3]|nr:aminoglycoside phosphotransferase family protein [Jidongwangia harbinensis]